MRWADVVEEGESAPPPPPAPAPTPKPLSVSLSSRPYAQCQTCGRSYYINSSKHKHCKSCFGAFTRRKHGPKVSGRTTTTSPSSSRTNSSAGDESTKEVNDDRGLLEDLEQVLTKGLSFGSDAEPPEPPPPPPPPPPVVVPLGPQPVDVNALLHELARQPTPAPPAQPPPTPTTATARRRGAATS